MALALYGTEFLVSTDPITGTRPEFADAAASLANGGFVLTYHNNYPSYSYFARVYDGFGDSIAGPTGTEGINGFSAYLDGGIAELSNARLVEAFSKAGEPGDTADVGVAILLPDLTGTPAVVTPGPEAPTTQTGLQDHPGVAASQLGGYMVVWGDDAVSYGPSGENVIAQVFDNDGVAVAPAFVVSEAAFSADDQHTPDVASLAGGGYVVTWQDDSGIDGDGSGIRARVFSSSGTAVTGEKAVNQDATGNQTEQEVAALADGGFVVVWEDGGQIEARVFNESGIAVTGDVPVAQYAGGSKYLPEVTGLLDGGFLVTWTTNGGPADGGDGESLTVKARTFSASGIATSDEIIVNTVTAGGQCHSMAATLADGRVVISWTDESNILGTNHETRAQLLDPRLAGVTVTGTAGADKYVGSAFADVLKGEGGDDALRGGAGDDTLDGGSGADSMEGGTGNDTYVVDNAGDTVIEQAGEGTDTVKASIAYTLGANVENLTLMEPAAIAASGNVDATGNSLANTLTGNSGNNILDGKAGADTMRGKAGNDTYMVDNAGDTVIEQAGEGTDTVKASIAYTLGANVENLTLMEPAAIAASGNVDATGNSLANTLTGNSGNNILDGKAGADTMRGMAGNDTYMVDNAGDTVIEQAGEGTDTVKASISYGLGDNLEKLVLTGTASINGTGNALANTLVGNAADNRLEGRRGDDILAGGPGKDKLLGKGGKDVFVFADGLGKANADKIKGFKQGKDTIFLDEKVFSAVGGKLGHKEYVEGKKAHDANDHIIRDGKKLYYDPDGKGGAKQLLFARVDKKADLDHHDFDVGDFVI